jgi:hypothetical protein
VRGGFVLVDEGFSEAEHLGGAGKFRGVGADGGGNGLALEGGGLGGEEAMVPPSTERAGRGRYQILRKRTGLPWSWSLSGPCAGKGPATERFW